MTLSFSLSKLAAFMLLRRHVGIKWVNGWRNSSTVDNTVTAFTMLNVFWFGNENGGVGKTTRRRRHANWKINEKFALL